MCVYVYMQGINRCLEMFYTDSVSLFSRAAKAIPVTGHEGP
jgi:hypothetical protein